MLLTVAMAHDSAESYVLSLCAMMSVWDQWGRIKDDVSPVCQVVAQGPNFAVL